MAQNRVKQLWLTCACLLLVLLATLPLHAQPGEGSDVPAIATTSQDGFNLVVSEMITPSYACLQVSPPTHGWFAGSFTHLPVKTPVTLGLSMGEMRDGELDADVTRWLGLQPVMTYADPTQYAAYEWFRKDPQGRWISGDPFKVGEARYAGMELVPKQTVIPEEVASQFLSSDGAIWTPWREIDNVEVLPNVNIFRIRETYALPSATVAMRVPYTYTYLQDFLSRLQAAKLPGVTVDELGKTPGGRALQVIRVTDPTDPQANRQSILVIAREHATEPAGSWVAHGMLQTLLSEEGNARCVPIAPGSSSPSRTRMAAPSRCMID